MDEVAGARAWGEAMESGDEESEADISISDAVDLEDFVHRGWMRVGEWFWFWFIWSTLE